MLPVDRDQVVVPDVAEGVGEQAPGVHGPIVAHEDDPVPVQGPRRGERGGPFRRSLEGFQSRTEGRVEARLAAAAFPSLGRHPSQERRLDRPHDDPVTRSVVQEGGYALELLDPEVEGVGPAADRDQEEHLPGPYPEGAHEVEEVGQLGEVPPQHGRVDLDAEAEVERVPDRPDGPVERSRRSPDRVVCRGARAVQADRDRRGADVLDLAEEARGEELRHRRRDREPKAEVARVRGEREQLPSPERVAAGKDDDGSWAAEGGDLVEEPFSLRGGELPR